MKSKRLEISDTQGLPFAVVYVDSNKPAGSRWSVTIWSGCVTDSVPRIAFRRTNKAHVRQILRGALKMIPTLNKVAA